MKRRRKSEVVWADDFLFDRLYYGFCPNKAAWRAAIDRLSDHDIPYPAGSAAHMQAFVDNVRGKRCCLVTVAEYIDSEKPVNIVGLLAHEALHITQELMSVMGETHPSVEFEAHVLQGVTQELLDGYCATRRQLFAK